jgi:hypothetical protein
MNNFLNLPMHTARIPPVDPAPAAITAALAMHAGHIFPSSELLSRRRLSGAAALPLAGAYARAIDLADHFGRCLGSWSPHLTDAALAGQRMTARARLGTLALTG